MATWYSDQANNPLNTVPPVIARTQDFGGRVRVFTFSFGTGSAGFTSGDTIILGDIPSNARVLHGQMDFGAMGASATCSIGISGATTRYANAISVAAAGQSLFANTNALNMLSANYASGTNSSTGASNNAGVLSAKERILMTASGANWAASKIMAGWMIYVLD